MAGVMSVEGFGNMVTKAGADMSATYAIGSDARVGLYVDEADRPWTSSSPSNDNMAVTIEISNSAVGEPWPISDQVFNKAIELTVDICKRNGIKELIYTGDEKGNFTFHRFFMATACLPNDRTELLTPHGWVLLSDIKIGDPVLTVHVDTLRMGFSPVQNKVPLKKQDTYISRDFEGTADHRVMYYNQAGRQHISLYKDIFDKQGSLYLPNAGYFNGAGIPLSKADIEFIVAVQADGHYMKDGECLYGIEFHFSKERKIKRVTKLLNDLGFTPKISTQSDGTTKIKLYGKDFVESCEEYLSNKCFTWDLINMTPIQADFFLDVIKHYDGCFANNSYSSSVKENVNIVQAVAALNGVGTKITDDGTRVFFKKSMRSLGDNVRQRKVRQDVSCVTVESGFILIRQHGRTTITGNCPGTYIFNRAAEICDLVNKQLKPTPAPQPIPQPTGDVKVGSLVSIDSNAVYYNGTGIPSWVKSQKWYVSQITGNRAVLGKSENGKHNIQSPISTQFIRTSGTSNTQPVDPSFKSYTIQLGASSSIFTDGTGSNTTGVIGGSGGVFTIVGEQTTNGVKYGKLKSGAGWVKVSHEPVKVDNTIRVGDTVRVLNAIQYNGKSFKVYVDKYKVLELNGDRAVISADGKNVTVAINTKNLQKV